MKKARILVWICIFNFAFLFYFSPYKIGIYKGKSMNPVLIQDDLILLREFVPGKSELKKGMIVSYEDEGERIIHRIVLVSGEKIITKGDANDEADLSILISQIQKIYLFTIPDWVGIGSIFGIIRKNSDGFIALVIILFTILALLILTRKEAR